MADDYVIVETQPSWLTKWVRDLTQVLSNMELQCGWFVSKDTKDCRYKNLIFSPASLVVVASQLGKTGPYKIPANDILAELQTMVWSAKPNQAAKSSQADIKFGLIGPQISHDINSFLGTSDFNITNLVPRPAIVIAQKFNFFLAWQDFFKHSNTASLDDGSRIVPSGQISLKGSGHWEVANNDFAEGVRVPLEGGYLAEFYLLADNKAYTPAIPFDKLPTLWQRHQADITIPAGVETSYAYNLNNAAGLLGLGITQPVALAQFVSFNLIRSGLEVKAATLTQGKLNLNRVTKTFILDHSFYLVVWKPRGVSPEPVLVASIIKQPLLV